MRIAVIGAGAFGGWTAYHLLRAGAQVTLLEAWGAGHSRSSSGGETRIIRTVYGEDVLSVRFSARALQLWKEHEARWGTRLFFRAGALFLGYAADDFLRASLRVLHEHGIAAEELSLATAAGRYSQINFEGIGSVLFEPEAGYLTARRNCRTVVQRFVEEGGDWQVAAATVDRLDGELHTLALSNGQKLVADQFVFACGPWLPQVFPDVLASVIRPTRQQVAFLSTPAGDDRFSANVMPCWADRTSEEKFYGIPDVEGRGFKIASDLRGAPFEPTTGDRRFDDTCLPSMQKYVGHRFPALADAALLESRVCQYENTPDFGLLIDRHPHAGNVLLVGGGSGHGYKQGPAVGEYAARVVLENTAIEPGFSLARFTTATKQPHCSF